MASTDYSENDSKTGTYVAGAFACVAFLAHALTNHGFGFHHDELYFIACGQHFAFGYVDHPPMVPWLARLSVELFGDSLRGLRLWSALAHGVTIFLTARCARELGGGGFAQAIAAVATLFAPVFLRAGNILAIPSFEPLYWILATFLVIRIAKGADPKWWLAVGLVAGVGLLNKHTMLFWGAGLTVGLLLTEHRRLLKSPWVYAGGALAGLVFLPNLLWQMQNDWATVAFIRQLNAGTMSRINPIEFIVGQVLYLNPFAFPLWLGGVVFAFTRAGKTWRLFGWMYLFLFVLLILVKSKIYYLAPIYPILFGLGGVAWEHWFQAGPRRLFRPVLAAAIAVGGTILLPISLPVLPIDTTDRYVKAATLGLVQNAFELTGDLHGQFGWREIVRATGEAYAALPDSDRERALLFGSNYGIAGALDLWGGAYGLPRAHSNVLSYHRWGLDEPCCDVVLSVSTSPESFQQFFGEITELGVVQIPDQNPWAQQVYILLCKAPVEDLKARWPSIFDY